LRELCGRGDSEVKYRKLNCRGLRLTAAYLDGVQGVQHEGM
jgi:hypothetical protein